MRMRICSNARKPDLEIMASTKAAAHVAIRPSVLVTVKCNNNKVRNVYCIIIIINGASL